MKPGKNISLGVAFAALLLLSSCSTPSPARKSDVELSRLALSARRTFEQGQVEGAARLYRKTLDRARAADNSAEIATNAYNLAVCLAALGKYGEARPYLEEAATELIRRGADTTDVQLLEAKTAYLGGDPERAKTIAEKALGRGDALNPAARVQFTILLARISLDRNDPAGAKSGLALATAEMAGISDPLLEAETAGLAGAVLSAESSFAAAGGEFDRQAAFCQTGEKYREMAAALGKAGGAYLAAGKNREAADRFFRSARSYFAQGETIRSLKMIEAALATLDKETDAETFGRIAALFDEIKKSVPPPATE
jgi:tetratricopeptide (TPR) repeat protein